MQKVWLISGCSKGFGRVLAEELLANTQAFVVATARQISTLDDLVAQYPERVLALQLDVSNSHDIQNAIQSITQKIGRIDVLVNNAGYGIVSALEECPISDIRAIFDTNVFGLIELTQAVLPLMRHQKSGHILNISSVAGLVSMAGATIYNATKFAVEGLSEGLAQEIATFGIHLTIIEPGPFRTDFAGESLKIIQPHSAYQGTLLDQTRAYYTQVHNNQTGDPVKAARMMIEVAKMDNPPLRLPLGNIAMDRIHTKFTKQNEDFKQLEAWARSADFDT